jgi:DNA polymerase III sliding clamp (beta) subunit (PCNA family)
VPTIPFAKVEEFISEDEKNYKLTSAWLDVEVKRLIATDGHRAIRVGVEINEGETTGYVPVEAFELARKELKQIRKALKDELPDPWLKVNCFADEIFIENLLSNTKHIVNRPKLKDGDKFPDVDRVIPTVSGPPTVSMSRILLSEICAALDGEVSISFWVKSFDSAVAIGASSGQAAIILMPMNIGDFRGEDLSKRGAAKAETVTA